MQLEATEDVRLVWRLHVTQAAARRLGREDTHLRSQREIQIVEECSRPLKTQDRGKTWNDSEASVKDGIGFHEDPRKVIRTRLYSRRTSIEHAGHHAREGQLEMLRSIAA
jgi:hypothetical protein